MTARNSTSQYALGSTDAEHERLIWQAERVAPLTERLFREAGIGPGQRVLDLGSGVGDVAMLAARLVGPSGEVVGIERDPRSGCPCQPCIWRCCSGVIQNSYGGCTTRFAVCGRKSSRRGFPWRSLAISIHCKRDSKTRLQHRTPLSPGQRTSGSGPESLQARRPTSSPLSHCGQHFGLLGFLAGTARAWPIRATTLRRKPYKGRVADHTANFLSVR